MRRRDGVSQGIRVHSQDVPNPAAAIDLCDAVTLCVADTPRATTCDGLIADFIAGSRALATCPERGGPCTVPPECRQP
jgi:hypothetical protein